MNFWDILIIGVLIIVFGFAVFLCRKRKKQGGCCGCGDCRDCCKDCKK